MSVKSETSLIDEAIKAINELTNEPSEKEANDNKSEMPPLKVIGEPKITTVPPILNDDDENNDDWPSASDLDLSDVDVPDQDELEAKIKKEREENEKKSIEEKENDVKKSKEEKSREEKVSGGRIGSKNNPYDLVTPPSGKGQTKRHDDASNENEKNESATSAKEHSYNTRHKGGSDRWKNPSDDSDNDMYETRDPYKKIYKYTYPKTPRGGRKEKDRMAEEAIRSILRLTGHASVDVTSEEDSDDRPLRSRKKERNKNERYENPNVDPKRIHNMERNVPELKSNNFRKYIEALKEQAQTYDWPSYILDLESQTWSKQDEETTHNRVRRKEAYSIMSKKISDDLRDQVIDTDHLGNAQRLFRRIHKAVIRSTEDYAQDIEGIINSAHRRGCKNHSVIQYGNFLKIKSDLLKEIGEEIPQSKLVRIYRKGLPKRLEALEINIKEMKHKYTTLAEAREYVETFCRDKKIEHEKFKNDSKYKTYNEERRKSRKESNNNLNTEERICKYFTNGSCKKGNDCDMKHVKTHTNNDKKNNTDKSKKDCVFYKKGNCRNGNKCEYKHNKSNETNTTEEKKEKGEKKDRKPKRTEYTGLSEIIDTSDRKKRRKLLKEKIEYRSKFCEKNDYEGYLGTVKSEFRDMHLSCLKENIEDSYKEIIEINMNQERIVIDMNTNGNLTESKNNRNKNELKHKMIIDSGAMSHSTPDPKLLHNIRNINNITVKGVGKGETKIKMMGDMRLSQNEKNIKENILLKNVLVLPHSGSTIISVPRLDEAGFNVTIRDGILQVSYEDTTVLEAQMINRLYVIARPIEIQYESNLMKTEMIRQHKIYGHLNYDAIRAINKMKPASKENPNPKCEACDSVKIPELATPKESEKEATVKGYAIHIDISPKHPSTLGEKYIYIIEFIDEYSKYIMIEPCRKRSDAFDIIKNKIREIQNIITPKKISIIRCDGAKELVVDRKIRKFYKSEGIRLKMSAPYHQYQNGLIERNVRTINEGAKAMMVMANSPDYDWLFAKNYFIYLRNHFHIPEGLECPPAELWEGVNSALEPKGPFGCKVMAKILYKDRKSTNVSKSVKSRKCVYLGIDETCKAFIVRPYDGKKTTRSVRYAKRVSFYEDLPYTHKEVPRPKEGGEGSDTSSVESFSESESDTDDTSESESNETNSEAENDSTQSDHEIDGGYGSEGELSSSELLDAKHNQNENEPDMEKDILDDDYESTDEFKKEIEKEDDEEKESDSSSGEDLIDSEDSVESKFNIDESSSEEEYKTKLRTRKKINYKEPRINEKTKRKIHANMMKEICNNFEHKTFNHMIEDYTRQNIYNQNIFMNDREELDSLYKKYGREKTPHSYKAVLNSPYKKFWLNAINDEVSALKQLGVFELTRRKDVPKGIKILRLLNIMKTKMCQFEDRIDKHKSRICADGSAEKVEPYSTFAPTVVYHSVLMLLMLACHYDLDIITVDIKNFFIRCDMGEDIVFVEQIEGFEDAPRATHVYKLKKALYGTKKASRKAQQALTKILTGNGFKSLKSDPMVFFKYEKSSNYSLAIIAGWVDDLLCIGDRTVINEALKALKNEDFDITMDESPKAYTGVQFDRDRKKRWMKVHQTEYARQLIWDAGYMNCKPVRSPILKNRTDFEIEDIESRKNFVAEDAKRREYQSKCGALIWLVKTRPDIAFAVGVLCRHMQNPNDLDFVRLKRVLQYIAHSIEIGYIWENKSNEKLEYNIKCNLVTAYADSDLAGRIVDSRSTSGYILRFCKTGSFLCVSKMQQTVAVGTTQAELICACECAKTIEWVRGFLRELNLVIDKPTILYQDNRGALELSKNPVYHFRTRHYRIAQHYLRELEKNGTIETMSMKSKDMWGDLMNKPQPPVRHLELRKLIMGE